MTFSSSSPGYSLQGTEDPQYRSEVIHADYNPAYDPSNVFEERLASICGSIEAVEMKCEASDERRRDAEKQLLVVTQRCLSAYCGFLTTRVLKLRCGLKPIRCERKPLRVECRLCETDAVLQSALPKLSACQAENLQLKAQVRISGAAVCYKHLKDRLLPNTSCAGT